MIPSNLIVLLLLIILELYIKKYTDIIGNQNFYCRSREKYMWNVEGNEKIYGGRFEPEVSV